MEPLAAIKNPPIVYAKQANFAAGYQQVNNGVYEPGPAGVPAHAGEKSCRTNYWSNSMATSWTPELRQWQRELIQPWKPWEKSTGPKSPEGKTKISQNANKGEAHKTLRETAKIMKNMAVC